MSTSATTQHPSTYRFGSFTLDPGSGELRRNGARLKLQDQPLQILLKLLANAGDVVTREELRSALWATDTFVDFDAGLNTAIKRLRDALGDSADVPRFIETVPRRGYRFIGSLQDGIASSAPPAEKAEPLLTASRLAAGMLALLLAGGVGALVVWLRSPLPPPRIVNSRQITSDGLAKGNLVSDGSEIYFNERLGGEMGLLRVPVRGGPSTLLESSPTGPYLADISSDFSKLLLVRGATMKEDVALEVMDLPSTAKRPLGRFNSEAVSWSPEGKVIICRQSAIYIQDADGAQPRKLLETNGFPFYPRFSPDGKRIRFSVGSSLTSGSSLWEANADGTGAHELLTGWNNPAQECCGNWTPDGRYYYFQSIRDGASKVWILAEARSFFRNISRDPVQLTTEPLNFYSATASRDGKKLFALAAQPRAELVRYDARSNSFVPFLSGMSSGDLAFSHDSRSIVYVKYPEGTLWRSKADGSDPVQLTNPSIQVGLPKWSPDDKQIAFSATKPGQPWNVFLMPSEGGVAEQITFGKVFDLDPSWSPDGKTLAFGGVRTEGKSMIYSVQLLDLATRKQSQISNSDGMCCPRWSPDGRYLVGTTQTSEELTLYDFATQKWTSIAKGMGTIGYMAWSRDGKSVIFDTFDAKEPYFYRIRISDLHLDRIASLKEARRYYGPWGPWTGIAPDDSPLFVRDISNQEIYALDWQLP
jgi:Tol biopolymer transport system component/DNA-binding winged helix-turn-helix (wHTH) protein